MIQLLLLLVPALAADLPKINSEYGKVVGECSSKGATRHVWVFKQWHLSPSANTRKTNALQSLPQEENQTALYRQLDSWIKQNQLNEIYAEGCSGELTEKSTLAINGWTIRDLKPYLTQPTYPKIVSSVPLKLEAKHGAKLRTLCGDNLNLIKKHGLAFSDARGALGFLSRIEQFKDDPVRVKNYLEGAIEAYKLPSSTTAEQVIARLKVELKGAVGRAKTLVLERNAVLIKRLKASSESNVAVVFGGLHADGIVASLNSEKIGCSVVEPTGYRAEDEKLLQKLEAL